MAIPFVVIGIIILLFYIQQTTPHPEAYCTDADIDNLQNDFCNSVYRDLIHATPMQLIWVCLALYELSAVEMSIGSGYMLILVLWLIVLSNVIQHYSQRLVNPIVEENQKNKVLNQIGQTIRKINPLPCDLGFLGITLALGIVAVYLNTTGRLINSWSDIQWIGLQIVPALLFANVTVHGQVSGFAAGVITVMLLDQFGIGY